MYYDFTLTTVVRGVTTTVYFEYDRVNKGCPIIKAVETTEREIKVFTKNRPRRRNRRKAKVAPEEIN